MIRFVCPDDGKASVGSALYDEYAGDPSAKPALKRICRAFGNDHLEHMLQMGSGPRVRYFTDNQSGQWENVEDALRSITEKSKL
jgi:hypothetical protein